MIPHCSGDVFSGDTEAGFKGRPQIGYKNVAAYLPRLASTFRDADRVVLTGMSAGGYGAAYNFVQVQRAFSWVDVTMVDDSGPTLATRYTPTCLQQQWRDITLRAEPRGEAGVRAPRPDRAIALRRAAARRAVPGAAGRGRAPLPEGQAPGRSTISSTVSTRPIGASSRSTPAAPAAAGRR
jgi:hypothetical protein